LDERVDLSLTTRGYVFAVAHEDDVRLFRWQQKYDEIPEDTKDPMLIRAKKNLKKKMPRRREGFQYWTERQFQTLREAPPAKLASRGRMPWRLLAFLYSQIRYCDGTSGSRTTTAAGFRRKG
jgi:hypothetical protein